MHQRYFEVPLTSGQRQLLDAGLPVSYQLGDYNGRPVAIHITLSDATLELARRSARQQRLSLLSSAAQPPVRPAPARLQTTPDEEAYVARLVAHLQGRPRGVLRAQLGADVPMPEGVPGSLGDVLKRHPSLFTQHSVGPGAEAVSLFTPSAAETEYVARLVAYLQASAQEHGLPHELLSQLGSNVPRPSGVRGSLGLCLRRHPNIFNVHCGVGTSSASVSLMSGPVPSALHHPSARQPSAPRPSAPQPKACDPPAAQPSAQHATAEAEYVDRLFAYQPTPMPVGLLT